MGNATDTSAYALEGNAVPAYFSKGRLAYQRFQVVATTRVLTSSDRYKQALSTIAGILSTLGDNTIAEEVRR